MNIVSARYNTFGPHPTLRARAKNADDLRYPLGGIAWEGHDEIAARDAHGCSASFRMLRRALAHAGDTHAHSYAFTIGNANSNSDSYTNSNGNTYTYPDAWRDHA